MAVPHLTLCMAYNAMFSGQLRGKIISRRRLRQTASQGKIFCMVEGTNIRPQPRLVVDNDAPIRLARAVEIAFPHGGMTVSGLRKEAAKGRLVIERIAGKDFVTLAAINAMRAACRVDDPKRSRSGPEASKAVASQAALNSLLLNVKRQTGAAGGRKLAS